MPKSTGLTYPEPTEAPDWANETPGDNIYALIINAALGECLEDLKLSRKEYVMLKRCLAALRGYDLQAPADHPTSDGKDEIEITQEEIQMVAELTVAIDSFFVNLNKRLTEGATVEPGKWGLKSDGSDYREFYDLPMDGWIRYGLDISTMSAEPKAAGAV